jgi:hypothetical protein
MWEYNIMAYDGYVKNKRACDPTRGEEERVILHFQISKNPSIFHHMP